MYRRRARTGGRNPGYEPYLRLVGLMLVLLAVVLVFGVIVADLLLVVAVPVGVVGAATATFPGAVLSALAST